jgi:hypothetical protein
VSKRLTYSPSAAVEKINSGREPKVRVPCPSQQVFTGLLPVR